MHTHDSSFGVRCGVSAHARTHCCESCRCTRAARGRCFSFRAPLGGCDHTTRQAREPRGPRGGRHASARVSSCASPSLSGLMPGHQRLLGSRLRRHHRKPHGARTRSSAERRSLSKSHHHPSHHALLHREIPPHLHDACSAAARRRHAAMHKCCPVLVAAGGSLMGARRAEGVVAHHLTREANQGRRRSSSWELWQVIKRGSRCSSCGGTRAMRVSSHRRPCRRSQSDQR